MMSEQRGSMAVETVILTPIFVLLLVFVSYASRVVTAQHELNRAADVAARAASQVRSTSMTRKGIETAASSIRGNRSHCLNFTTQVSRRTIAEIIHVEVQTSCRVDVFGLSLLGIRSPELTATSTEVVDVYRHP
jgi:Flp pilus assembly protein TadG